MKNFTRLVILSTFLQLSVTVIVSAQIRQIVPDSSFGTNGVVISPNISPNQVTVSNIDVQPDGKIVVAAGTGNAGRWPCVIRCKSDGTLDSTFGTYGYANLPVNSSLGTTTISVKVLASGEILANGFNDSSTFITRIKANGVIDSTFGVNGFYVFFHKRPNHAIQMVVLQDGSIISGYSQYVSTNFITYLVKTNSNGVIDNTFGTGGLVTVSEITDGESLLLDHNNRLLITGNTSTKTMGMVRLLSDGTYDNSFGKMGVASLVAYDSALSFSNSFYGSPQPVLLSDNSIIVLAANSGSAHPATAAVHLFSNGIQDISYGQKYGLSITAINLGYPICGVALENDEVLFDGYYTYQGAVSDYHGELSVVNTSGRTDSVFGKGIGLINIQYDSIGKSTYLAAMLILPNGEIMTAGITSGLPELWLARYKYTGFSGVNEKGVEDAHLQLFPNPTAGFATLKYQNIYQSAANIRIIDLTGKTIIEKILPAGQENLRVETSGLQDGVYMVQLKSANQIATTKLVVKH